MIEAVPWSDFIMAIIVWIFFIIIVMILIELWDNLDRIICRIFDHSEKEVQRRQWQSGDKFEITRCSRCHEILNLKSKVN